jgi:hypothetical protein
MFFDLLRVGHLWRRCNPHRLDFLLGVLSLDLNCVVFNLVPLMRVLDRSDELLASPTSAIPLTDLVPVVSRNWTYRCFR